MIKLYRGDCLKVLRKLDAGSVDAVVTDPPYGIGFRYGGGTEAASTPEAYWQWLEPIHREAMRVLKPGGFPHGGRPI